MSTTSTSTSHVTREGDLLWSPSPEQIAHSGLQRYIDWLHARGGPRHTDYASLWQWSVTDPNAFWTSMWQFHDVQYDGSYAHALRDLDMPGTPWFVGARVNYAEHMLRHEAAREQAPALIFGSEGSGLTPMSWHELGRQVRILATQLRKLGVQPGDRVAAYLSNTPEAVVAMMATVAIGAVWTCAAPEFGLGAVVDRFGQVEPKVLITCTGYSFGGKPFDRLETAEGIVAALPSLKVVITVGAHAPIKAPRDVKVWPWAEVLQHPDVPAQDFRYERVDWRHPLWILYSSGTTGKPKAIVHGHVGVLTEHLKATVLHLDLSERSTIFFYSTTAWMMWNALVSALLAGSTVVLYDGSPMHPAPDVLWSLAAQARVTHFGASPTFVQLMQKANVRPAAQHDVSALETIVLSGSPATPENFSWFYQEVKPDLWVTSLSGGTELVGGLVGAIKLQSVRAGQIQGPMLGMAVQAWTEAGKPVDDIGQVGELVVTQPAPSMPLRMWGDVSGDIYRSTYFEMFPKVWRHGDLIRFDTHGGCYIEGRSDSTLNRYGVRLGTAEIYRALDAIPEVADAIVVCCEPKPGSFDMPLFLRLKPGFTVDAGLVQRITATLREQCSPRHVPDRMVQVDQIPYTLTGKKMEVPLRKVLTGTPPSAAASRDSMMNPGALEHVMERNVVSLAQV